MESTSAKHLMETSFDGDIILFSGEIAFKVFCKVSRKNMAGSKKIGIKIKEINIHSAPPSIVNKGNFF